MKMIALFKNKTMNIVAAAAILIACVLSGSFTTYADELPEPYPHPSSYLQDVHVGQDVVWQPYQDYPELTVSYTSSDPDIIQISENGELTVLREGVVEITASTSGNENYRASAFTNFMETISSEEGLYLIEGDPHFYYRHSVYGPGELPLETEKELCKRDPALKVFLEDYLEPYQSRISDRTEAALTALLNYADKYYSRYFVFDKNGGAADVGKTQWMELLRTHTGLCAPTSSLFCYMMYLSGLPSMQVDSGGDIEQRAHTWNLIEHDGYYYNFEEYDFMVGLRKLYAIPPFTVATAEYFADKIYGDYYLHFPVPGATFTPDKKVEDMGRDLSVECPVLIYERLSDGTYRARFETIRKGQIPAYEDGTALELEELTYKNMESDALPDASGTGDQVNEYALPLFKEASQMLFSEISPLFETGQDPQPVPREDTEPVTQPDTQSGSQQNLQPAPQEDTEPVTQQDPKPNVHEAPQQENQPQIISKVPQTGDDNTIVFIEIPVIVSAVLALSALLLRKKRR